MIQQTVKIAILTLTAIVLAACSSPDQPLANPETTGATTSRESTRQMENTANQDSSTNGTSTSEHAANNAATGTETTQRIDHLLPTSTPVATSANVAEIPTAEPQPARGQPETEVPTISEAKTPENSVAGATEPNITDLVPENPQTSDQVLLQEIYRRIDLEQFALDPEEPIQYTKETIGLIPYDHPYLHLFLDLNIPHPAWERNRNGRITYKYIRSSMDEERIMYFIHHPWFEKVHTEQRLIDYENPSPNRSYYYDKSGTSFGFPIARQGRQLNELFWFGNNSTRGILAETVAELLKSAQTPAAEPHPREWFKETGRGIIRDWTIEEYVRYGINTNVSWELVHPQLPIVRVNVHAKQGLPLIDLSEVPAPAGFEKYEDLPRGEQGFAYREWKERTEEQMRRQNMIRVREFRRLTEEEKKAMYLEWYNNRPIESHKARALRHTSYSISFVVSFQHRWTSFNDPNRWSNRFGEDLEKYDKYQQLGLIYPHYWDDVDHWDHLDYMQHRIIGPVVLTVHPPADRSQIPVLQPGNYSRLPRVSHWEAPGYILSEKQVQYAHKRTPFYDSSKDEGPYFRIWPNTEQPNTGFPLPGHVMVYPRFGPGTETWEQFGMEEWEAYDRSLDPNHP